MDCFEKVIGYESEKLELKRYCDLFKNIWKYKALGVNIPRGILIDGEPGIGKTLMAQCFIDECGITSYTIRKELSDGEFIKQITDTFNKAKENAPAIVFLDDMDKFSNEDENHKNSEEFVVIQSCIDDCKGFDVFVIATVNNRWSLPNSLLRTGRFDKSLRMDMPCGEDAVKIIEYYMGQKNILEELDAQEIGRILQGHSCSDLETIINEAGIYAVYDGKNAIDQESMIKACCRCLFKEEYCIDVDPTIINGTRNRAIAIHEMGHALVGEIFREGSVSFVALGNVNGVIEGITVSRRNEKIRSNDTREENEIDIMISLGGKAATEVVSGEFDMGALDDLISVSSDVYRLVAGFGISGLNTFKGGPDASEIMERDIECAVNVEINRLYEKTKKIIIENRTLLDSFVEELMKKRYLTYKDILRIRREAAC